MEILSSVIGKIVELTVEPIGRQLSYLCFINDNFQKLKNHVEMLKETRETVQRMVYDARRNVEDIKLNVQNWLTKVDAIIERSELILTKEGQQIRFCLNLVERHQLSRKAVKMTKEILKMKNEGNFDRVSYNIAKYESSLIKTSDFLHFESRRSTKEQIIDALVDDNVKKVGIYGMGGIGKTTIVKEISREVMEQKIFDEVVVSTISQTPDLKRIQGELAEKLGIIFEEDTMEVRALKLHKRLKIGKKSLIVFDDIWTPIDLEAIGIPIDVDHKECKILFTSRDKHTLSNDMCIDNNFELKVLEKDEAWDFFKSNVGEMIETFDLNPIAIQIVRECANLPIAILTVAKALKNKNVSIWKDALNQLRNPEVVNIRGMNEKVYASLKLSYDQLECKEAKMLFLLCSIFPEDFKIDMELLHIYATAFDFLHGVNTIAKRRHRITKLVDDLVSSSLLQNCEDEDDNDHVQMHDLVRDVAISYASKDDQIRTLSCVKNWNEWEADEVSGNHTAVYIDFKNGQNSPKKLMLPKVKLLTLTRKEQFLRSGQFNHQKISINFFEEMKELKVLVLQMMKISLLPQSFHYFINVRSLHFIFCKLENIDMIFQLKKLEILSFQGSNITKIPMAMSQLTQLKVLDLSFCHELAVIPANVLSKLTNLEELNMLSYNEWEGEELNKERKNASISELKNMRGLSTLCLSIEDEKVMPKEKFFSELKLETYIIHIGSPSEIHIDDREFIRNESCLKIESECSMNDEIKTLIKRSETLHLEGSFGAKLFLFGFDEYESSHVKHLDLINICGLQHIIHSQKQPLGKALSNLVHLCLKGLKNLECIVYGHDRKSLLSKLKFVKVKKCKILGGLFLNCIMDDLLNLVKIEIKKCEMIDVIVIMANEGAVNKFEFTHLKTLQLCCLPQLKKFSSNIEKDGTSNFSNNDSFFSEEVSLPNLEKLEIKEADNLKMICGKILFLNSFSKLAEVYIDSCKNLEKVFSGRIMSILTCLKIISIKNCNLLEEIFEAQESNIIRESIDLLPQLKELKLSNLPNLRYVWSDDPCELQAFKNMKILSILQCPKLRKECVINVLHLPHLKNLETDLNKIEWSMETSELRQLHTSKVESLQLLQDGEELFSKLKFLKLHDSLDYHKTHLSMEFLHLLPCLEIFEVNNALIEEIFPSKKLIRVKEHQYTISELLENLTLSKLPKLKHLWKESSQNTTPVLFQHLKILQISECGILNTFVPSSVSFRNLRDLSVVKCHKLTHLLNPSMAKSLVQLEFLMIDNCKRMNTIIDRVGGVEEGNDEIVFNKLYYLHISMTPKLENFHSGRCIIKFPCLKYLKIYDCFEMKVFSLGYVRIPPLDVVSISIYNNHLLFFSHYEGGDINVFFQKNWEESLDSNVDYLFA